MTGAALLLFLLVPALGRADPKSLVPPPPDLPAAQPPSVLPSSEPPLKFPDQLDDVVKGVTEPPAQSPPPTSGGNPGEEPPGDDGGGSDGGGGGGGGGNDDSAPGRGPGGPPSAPVTEGAPDRTAGPDVAAGGTELPVARSGVVWRAVAPSLGTLSTRARSLVAPLAAPMGLGVVAVMLLGLATRGPGVISKLNEELESADGRQVWRL